MKTLTQYAALEAAMIDAGLVAEVIKPLVRTVAVGGHNVPHRDSYKCLFQHIALGIFGERKNG
jgi:hypothetical protein